MDKNLKDKLKNITIPENIDKKIELGFDEARIYKNKRKNKFRKSLIGLAASFALVFISMSLIGFDKVEAAIKQVLQYIPGFNYVIESDEDNVLVLKDKVFYEEDDFYVTITAAAKLNGNLNVAVESNYMIADEEINKYFDHIEISLKDENGNSYNHSGFDVGSGGKFWSGEYFFEVEDASNSYFLLVNDMEVPFTLEEGTKVEDFLQLGNHASYKGIDIVAIKKPLEDGLMISLLNQSNDKMVIDYPFQEALSGINWNSGPLEFEKSMYILDKEGNKTYPNIPSSFAGLMSDFYFDIEDKEGLQLLLPYLRIRNSNVKSDKLKIETPNDGELIDINKVLAIGEFEMSIFDVKRQDEEILIRVESNFLEDEFLDSISLTGINAYGLCANESTGEIEITIDVEDVGSSFSIYFEDPETILLGNWIIDLD